MGLLKKFNKSAHKKTALALLPFAFLNSCIQADVDTVHLPTAQELIEMSGGLLTRDQAQVRSDNARLRHDAGLNVYASTRSNHDVYYNNCFQMDYTDDQVPQSVRQFYNNIRDLRESDGAIASHLRNHSVKADIFMCFTDQLPETTRGQWRFNDPDGIVKFNRCTSYDSRMEYTALHEIFHAVQEDHGLDAHHYTHSVYDMQMRTMGLEAAARVTPRLYEFEKFLNQDDSNFMRYPAEKTIDRAILNAYKTSAENGMSHFRALEQAGAAGWNAVYDMQWWLDAYNKSTIRNFISAYQLERLRPLDNQGYTLQTAQTTGKFDQSFNFTRDIQTLPSIDRRIGNNEDFRNIFQFLMTAQLKQAYGEQSPQYQEALATATADQNPYLTVDLNDVNFNSNVDAVTQLKNLATGGDPAPDAPRRSVQITYSSNVCN